MCESCGCGDPNLVPVDLQQRILSDNERTAAHNRHHFVDRGLLAIAHTLAAGPTQAFATAKMLINQAAGVDRIDFNLDQELHHLSRSADGDEFREGLRAFLEKRPPIFTRPAVAAVVGGSPPRP